MDYLANLQKAPALPFQRQVRVGALLDGLTTASWIHATLQGVLRAKHLELALIVHHDNTVTPTEAAEKLPALLKLWRWADFALFKAVDDPLGLSYQTYDIDTVTAVPLRHEGRDRFGELAIARIRAANLDVLLQLGYRQLYGDILTCAKYGVWTFHPQHRSIRTVCSGQTSELTLRVATDRGAIDGPILYRGTFSNQSSSLYNNQSADCRRRSQILLRRLSDLHDRGWENILVSDKTRSNLASRSPLRNTHALHSFTREVVRGLHKKLDALLVRERWTIAYRSVSERGGARWEILQPAPGRNYADPFLFEHCGKSCVFFESWRQDTKGDIWCVQLNENGKTSEAECVLSRPYHLSFPFVFQWHGDVYMLPETRQNSTLEVYRATAFPTKWELAAVLMKGVSLVDSTILEYDGRLWLFTAGLGGPDFRLSELSLFFADSLFGPWRQHARNPVVCDIRHARPAGALFFRNGELIRPAQDCSCNYGYAVSLNRIDALSVTEYRERPVAHIVPDRSTGIRRTHTFNRTNTYECIDLLTAVRAAPDALYRLNVGGELSSPPAFPSFIH